jgi:hypothetical protein
MNRPREVVTEIVCPPEGPDPQAAQPGLRIMHPVSAPEFQAPRIKMESEWTPQMMHVLGIDFGSLPIIWDTFSTDLATHRAGTPTCFTRSMSAPCSRFRKKRLQRSRALQRFSWYRKNGARRSTIDEAANIVAQRWPSASRTAMFRTSAIIQDTCIEAKKVGRPI